METTQHSGRTELTKSGRTFSSVENAEKMEVLVSMYEQLDQNHHHHNKVIFQTYYLSVIFFGAIGSFLLNPSYSDTVTAGIATFGALVMLVLWFWAYMYLKGRRQIKEHKSVVIRELEQHDEEFVVMDSVREAFFFKHKETPQRTVLAKLLNAVGLEVEGDFLGVEHRKDVAQWGYFLMLSLVFSAFAGYVLLV
ncbi:hypothetical protein [Halobellus ruber]|uniref:Uncharacterized protein n=1 Tax=Halobellus ruber TaxID=2761102 RepID=A0A7J9SMJ3_9EURY|nr:hypothetical protein [Halobellus ruber]MBB6647359.1 hypothetical protein [Halobellus ruber]